MKIDEYKGTDLFDSFLSPLSDFTKKKKGRPWNMKLVSKFQTENMCIFDKTWSPQYFVYQPWVAAHRRTAMGRTSRPGVPLAPLHRAPNPFVWSQYGEKFKTIWPIGSREYPYQKVILIIDMTPN